MVNVAVFCASSEVPVRYRTLAADLGQALAAAGHTLVWGGQTLSLMGEVASAAQRAGGSTMGFIPHAFTEFGPDNESTSLVITDTLRKRKLFMEENSSAFVVLPGGLGTADEFIEMWAARYAGVNDSPVIVLDPWDFYEPLFAWFAGAVAEGFVQPSTLDLVDRVKSVADVLELLGEVQERTAG